MQRPTRQPLTPQLVRRVAQWNPSTVAIIAMLVGLVAHEIAYHLSGGDDFPLTLLAGETRAFVISHGGLDALGVGILVVSVLWIIEAARIHEGRPR